MVPSSHWHQQSRSALVHRLDLRKLASCALRCSSVAWTRPSMTAAATCGSYGRTGQPGTRTAQLNRHCCKLCCSSSFFGRIGHARQARMCYAAPEAAYVGIDFGTSGCRLCAIDGALLSRKVVSMSRFTWSSNMAGDAKRVMRTSSAHMPVNIRHVVHRLGAETPLAVAASLPQVRTRIAQ